MKNNDSLIVLSGGIDSTTLLAYIISKGYSPIALTFDYHQRNSVEIKYAKYHSKSFSLSEHIIFPLFLDKFKGSSLTNPQQKIDTGNTNRKSIPNTYVPSRNIIFLSIALSLAESKNIKKVFTGINAIDYSGYPDCRPEFLKAFNYISSIGTKAGVEGDPIIAEAPFIQKTKYEIINIGLSLNIDYSRTFSCYDPLEDSPCKVCDTCLFRREAFSRLSILDESIIYGGNL